MSDWLDRRLVFERAIRLSNYAAPTKAIALALKSRADGQMECWPSIVQLAKDAGVGRSTVYGHLAILCKDGFVERQSGGGRKSNLYRLLIPEGVEIPVDSESSSPAGGRQLSITEPGAVQLVDVSRPAAGHEVDQEVDKQEDHQSSAVAALVEKSLASGEMSHLERLLGLVAPTYVKTNTRGVVAKLVGELPVHRLEHVAAEFEAALLTGDVRNDAKYLVGLLQRHAREHSASAHEATG